MIAATVLLTTPMVLAAEPVRLEMLDQTYDHRTQTSVMNGAADKRLRLAYSTTMSWPPGCRDSHCGDVDND